MNIIKKEINISDELKRKINSACKYLKYDYTIQNGFMKHIENSNIGYVAPHIVYINDIKYGFYNDRTYFLEWEKSEYHIPIDQLLDYISRH